MIGISVVGMLPEQLHRDFFITSAALMMFLRIQCLYRQWKIVYYSVGLLFLIQTGVYAYLLSRGQRTVIVLYHQRLDLLPLKLSSIQRTHPFKVRYSLLFECR